MGTPFKCDLLSAGIGAVGSVLGGLVNSSIQSSNTKEQMRLQSKLNREEMAYSMGLQKDQQEWLMDNQYGKTVSGMKNAGLNPATANGVSPSVPSGGSPHSGSPGPSAGMPNIDLVSGALAGLQIQSLAKDVEAKEITNERNKITLKDEREAAKYGYRKRRYYVDPETGEPIADLEEWFKQHPRQVPNQIIEEHNRGQEIQRQQENEWKTQDFERNARSASAYLKAAIASGQLKDKDVMDAFIKLPANERKTLSKIWREYDDSHDLAVFQKDIAKLQKKDIEASSFGSLVNSLKGNMGFGEKFLAVLGFIFNRLTNNTGLNFGFSRSHSTSK